MSFSGASGVHLCYAPWTEEQVENLKARQDALPLHPYTCLNHSSCSLVPTVMGWVCSVEGCSYTQDWAHEIDANFNKWWLPFEKRLNLEF